MFNFEEVFPISALVSKEKELLNKARYFRDKSEKSSDDTEKSDFLYKAEALEKELDEVRKKITKINSTNK
jgi:hypothetical protein